MEPRIASILFSQIAHLPFLLVYVAGILLAIFRWPLHPRVSLMALAAFGMLLVGQIVRMGYMLWLISGQEPGLAFGRARLMMTWFNLGTTVLDLVAWVLLMVALFGGRRSAAGDPV